MALRQEILALAADHAGKTKRCAGQDDLFGAFGLAGDDANEFLAVYALGFGVDMSAFRWEFHYNADEPPSAFRRVVRIDQNNKPIPWRPITLTQLLAAAERGV